MKTRIAALIWRAHSKRGIFWFWRHGRYLSYFTFLNLLRGTAWVFMDKMNDLDGRGMEMRVYAFGRYPGFDGRYFFLFG